MFNDQYFGYHLILDCKEGIIDFVKSPEYIKDFVKRLVEEIHMKAYGEPIIENFAHDNPKTGGITLVQLIETSSITCHFVEATGDFYLDVFSCACYDIDIVVKLVNIYFAPKEIKQTYLTRQA